ncbi:MAG TPA: hypothetical protein VFZ34_29740 [Blastocatellia bacterium]|nr:hypothetical protein [Blastocatellia bacterium]
MNFTTRTMTRNITLIALLALGLFVSTNAQSVDYTKHWTTVGSAGTVDEADVNKIEFKQNAVQLKGGGPIVVQPALTATAREAAGETDSSEAAPQAVIALPTESAVIRYNVTAVDGLFTAFPNGVGYNALGMTVRYMASGPQGRVVVRLMEYDIYTGVEVERMKFDSSTQPQAVGYVTRGVGYPLPNWKFDFNQKAYYIEVTLSRSSLLAGGAAGLAAVKLNAYYQIL